MDASGLKLQSAPKYPPEKGFADAPAACPCSHKARVLEGETNAFLTAYAVDRSKGYSDVSGSTTTGHDAPAP